MAVVIRLMRAGAKKRPFYRVVAADSRRQRDGRFLEILGHYNPIAKPFELTLHTDKIERWLAQGAQPSTQVASLLRSAGMKPPKAASKPKAKKAVASGAKKARSKPRKVSERKVRARAVRKKKAAAKKPA
jgi:small subunit ribosomal protein S16